MSKASQRYAEVDTSARALLPETLEALLREAASLRWLHWKSNIRLGLSVEGMTDLDILVHPEDLSDFESVLLGCGFVPFMATPWSNYRGVSNWLGADSATGRHFHVHLHDRLLTGMKSSKEQDLPWTDEVIRARTTDAETGIPIIPAALEVQILLAREIAKSSRVWRYICQRRGVPPISKANREEMAYLQSRSTEADITHYGNMLWGPEAWAKAAPGLNSGEWATQKGLKALCAVLDPILQRSRRSLPVAYLRRLGMSVLKKATRLRQRIDQTTPQRMRMQRPAPIIAFVGSDGAGKSTVTADLRKWLSWKADCHTVYFGSKDESFRTAQRLVARFRKKKSPRRHGASEAKPKKPSFWQAFRAAHAAYLRLRNQRWAERMTARGQIVIADRLPQFEVAGIYDGPSGIDPRQAPLLARPFYWYEARATVRLAGLRPNLIVRMTVPFDVAVARKPDHDRAMLEQKIALTESLSFGNARSVRIDCTQPLDQVLLQVRAIAWAEIQAAAGSERR